jgi:hypothetical protein
MTAPAFIYPSLGPPIPLGGLFSRPSVHEGANEHRNVYGGIVDSAATLARSASPRTRRWSTIAHDRTSRGKSDQAICTRMNKLRMSLVDCQRTVMYVGNLS